MTDKTPSEIMADIDAMKVDLAKAQQPLLAQMVDAMNSDGMKSSLQSLKAAADGLSSSSNVSIQVNNLINIFNNTAQAVAREVNGVVAIINPTTTN